MNARSVFIGGTAFLSLLLLTNAHSYAASCLGADSVSADNMMSFKSGPSDYLAGKSGDSLTNAIEGLAASDSTSVQAIMTYFAGQTDADKASIATGLGKAAKQCNTLPDEANRITESMIGQPDGIKTAFNDAAGQALAGATGGGAGGGAGGAGGGQTATVFAQNTNGGDVNSFAYLVSSSSLNALFLGAGGGGIGRDNSPSLLSVSP
jgi:hypothetical protein